MSGIVDFPPPLPLFSSSTATTKNIGLLAHIRLCLLYYLDVYESILCNFSATLPEFYLQLKPPLHKSDTTVRSMWTWLLPSCSPVIIAIALLG